MKCSISWHEECLKNMHTNIAKRRREMHNAQRDIETLQQHIYLRERQIKAAKRDGKTEFDSDKYQIPRRRNL